MKNILVPLSSSVNSLSNLQYAIDLAKAVGATVNVARLYKAGGEGILPEELSVKEISRQEIEKQIAKVNKGNVEVVAQPLEGDDLQEAISLFHQELTIDLIVIAPQTQSVNDELYLGQVSGSIVKRTEIAVLIVPKDYVFKEISRILMAVKSGVIKKKKKLRPLIDIKEAFSAELRLLLVKTPDYKSKYGEIDKLYTGMVSSMLISENATVFQGVLEHLIENKPDMLCVYRRRRGFFAKLWADDTVKKLDFESRIPLLVLKGGF